ncbi:MAG: anthranilate synthase component I family protein [Crocinitomicaceae bacterium]
MKSTLAYLNGNDGNGLLALGETDRLYLRDASQIELMQKFIDNNEGRYIFMGLSYDLKTEFLSDASKKPDFTKLPMAFLWIPETVVEIANNQAVKAVQGELTELVVRSVQDFFQSSGKSFEWKANMKARTPKEVYLQQLDSLKGHIQYGSIYEVNYCQEFYDDAFEMEDAKAAYFRWNAITQAPFSTFVSFDEFQIMCGSPERFLKKEGEKLISQPIKGTRKRSSNPEADRLLKEELLQDPKERAENVMIVDLVRNDLSRVAQRSSVEVNELFGVYSFKTVHQLISTISCKVKPETNFTDILKATFPMGSMTGAPKRSAVSLIESHENFRRGWYSGSIGYIKPNGDFDLNVIIRSLIYNEQEKYLSCSVGGAITIQSDPEAEYEECNTKVITILDAMFHA